MKLSKDFSKIDAWVSEADIARPARILLQQAPHGTSMEHMETVDAKITAAEARTDTKFAELLGELKLMNQRLDHVERSTSGMKSTVIGTGIGVVAIVIAVMAYGAQWFGLGMDAQQVSERAVSAAVDKIQPQINAASKANSDLDTKIDVMMKAISAIQPSGSQIQPPRP